MSAPRLLDLRLLVSAFTETGRAKELKRVRSREGQASLDRQDECLHATMLMHFRHLGMLICKFRYLELAHARQQCFRAF